MNFRRRFAILVCGLLSIWLFSGQTLALDWSSAATTDITFFYPGRASWEKILTRETHEGATKVRQKATCQSCHKGDEAEMGKAIATDSDNPFYKPAEGPTSVNATLKALIQDGAIHFMVVLPGEISGELNLLLDNNAYMHSALSGCWSGCHDDARGMDSAGNLDLTKYLSISRTQNTRTGGGDSYKSAAELEALIADGQFLELIGAKFSDGKTQGLHGYVLDARHLDESGLVSANVTGENGTTLVQLSRPLDCKTSTTKAITPDGRYTIGLALHLNRDTGASHRVTLAIGFVTDQSNNIRFVIE